MKTTKYIHQTTSGLLLTGLLAAGPLSLLAASTTIYKTDTATMNSAALDWTAATGGAGGAVAPAFGEIGRFDSTISAANAAALTLGGNVSLDEIQFANNLNGPVTIANTGGYTLTLGSIALAGGTYGIDMTAANTNVIINCNITVGTNEGWNVASGQTLTVNGVLSGTSGGGILMNNGGTINLNGGGAVGGGTAAANYFSVESGTMNINSGSLTVSPQYRMNVGWNNSTPGVLNVSNATLTLSANTEVDVGGGYNGAQSTGTGTINVGGTSGTPGKFTLGTTTGSFILGVTTTATGSGTINLNGYGTLATGRSITSRGLANSAVINFNGGTLQLTAAQGTWIGSGVNVTNNSVGGTIDCQTFAGTIVSPINGVGGLTKLGAGTLTLSGANTYSGATTISAGKLIITTASTGGGAFSVANGATNNIKVATAGQTLAMSNLTLGTSAASTLEFDNGALANPSVAIANASSLTLNGTVTVNIYGTALSAGTFDLLAYGSKSGSGSWSLGTLPAGVLATLNDTGAKLQLVVSVANSSVVWKGYANNIWDIGTSLNTNWMNPSTLAVTFYSENGSGGPAVIFDDTAFGNTAISLGVAVKPASVTLSNNTAVYSITGAGSIASSIGLTKNGTGTFTLGVSNNFTGATINGGTLALTGANNVLPVTDTVTFSTNGTLNLGGNNQTLASITMASPSVVYKNSPSSTIANGVLTVSGAGSFNPATTNLPTTLDLSGLSGVYFTNATQTFTLNMNNPTANGTAILNLATNGAGTNFIAATTMNIGTGGTIAAATGATDMFNLGPWNTFWVNTFNMGAYRQQLETVSFQPGLTTSNLTIMGPGGTNRVANMNIGENNSGSAYDVANFIVGAGTFNCAVSNLTMGIHNISDTTAGRAPMATLDLGPAGNFDCLVLTNGQSYANASTYGAVVWISQHGGNAYFKTMIMGDNAGTTANCNLQSAYYLSGGTLYAQTIQPGNDGAGVSTASFRGINWTNGTIRNYNSTTPLTVTANGSTVPVTISAPGSGNRYFVVDAGLTNTINGPINQVNGTATPVVMSGPGTLDLQGTMDNPYFQLNVSNGVVLLDKQSTTTPSVHAIGSGLTLNGGSVILAANGGSGGDQIYDGNLVTLNSGTFDLNGQAETIGGLAGTGGTLADASGGGATLTVNVATGTNYTCGANITDGNLIFGGNGTQILTGTDSRNSESTTINNGMLQIGNGGSGGTLAGSAVYVNAPGSLVFSRSGTLNYTGNIYGNGSVAQNGSGTLALVNDQRGVYGTGGTFINNGTLAVPSGASTVAGSVVTVAAGATLDTTAGSGFYLQGSQALNGDGTVQGSYLVGSGATNSGSLTINGNLTLVDGSVLNPGALFSAGTITVNGNVTNTGNNQLIYNLSPATTPGGRTNSLLVVSGNLDLGNPANGNAPTLVIHGTPVGGTYVIATFGTFSGDVAQLQISAGGSTRYSFQAQISGHQLQLVVSGNAANLVWLGDGVNNSWDANDSGNPDWFNLGTSLTDFFNNGDNALFNDTSANFSVNINSTLLPASVTVHATNNYVFSGGADISGPIALTKTNSGSLTIQNNNTFTGPVNINGGVVSVASVDASANPQPLGQNSTLAFNGGTFQWTGGDVAVNGSTTPFDKQVSLGVNGGTFDLENSGGYFFLTNRISGAGSFTKIGPGQLILGDTAAGTGNNTYSGVTYVTNGEVQMRNTNALGSVSGKTVVTGTGDVAAGGALVGTILEPFDLSGVGSGNGALQANDSGTSVTFAGNINLVADAGIGGGTAFTISGNISGAGSLTKLGNNTVTLRNSNSYTGGTVISAGTLQLGTNGTSGWIPAQPPGVAITNNGTITFNRADTNAINDPITGTGSLIQNGSGLTVLGGANTFTGNVTVNGTTNGGVLLVTNAAALGGGIIMVNGGANIGMLQLAGNLAINNNFTLGQKAFLNGNGVQVQPPHITSLNGTNTLFGTITVGPGGNYWGFNSISGLLTVAAINNTAGGFARPIYLEGSGNGAVTNITDTTADYVQIQKYGAGTWTISGSADVPQGLQVNAGTLLVDANGTINQDNNANMASTVSGGTLVVNGSLAGNVTIANTGRLGGSGLVAGNVTVNSGGTLWPGTGGISTFTVNNNLTLGGNLMIGVYKSLAQSNDFVAVMGVLTNSAAGTVTVTNLNYLAPLVVGDTFTLFSQAVSNGAALNIVGGGASVTWTNNLAVDGTITVLSVTPPVTVNTNTFTITNSVVGNNLNLSWPADREGWRLQVQTNSLNSGLGSAWYDWPNSTNMTSVSIPLNPANPSVFLRMVYP